jgi:predicted TIM-barrel fold metal-dependent hydrolase
MEVDDLILVSVDDHVVEPPDVFAHRLPARWRDRAPRVVRKPDGTDVWVWDGQQIPNIGLNAVAGRPPEEYGMEPTSFDQLRPGCYDVDARVRDMNANGVLASLCFPSFPGLCGNLFLRNADRELTLMMLRAYNDWHVDAWCGAHPGRFIPLAIPPAWDPQAMADEVRRMARKGCHAVSFSENPEKLGLPSLHSPHWDPFWAACCDEGTIVCLHIGSGQGMAFTSMDAPVNVMITVQPIAIVPCAADLVWSRVLREFPSIRFALSEGGIGWVPYFLERADYVYRHHAAWTRPDLGGRLPSEIFRQHIVTCFISDDVGVRLRHEIGIESITWECDYPHSDTTWPNAPEILARSLTGVPDEDVRRITHENAMRHFRFDPFAHRPRHACTVGALRREATEVDLSLRSHGGKPPTQRPSGPVTTREVTEQLMSAFRSPVG